MRTSTLFLWILGAALVIGLFALMMRGCGMDDGALTDVRKASDDAAALAQAVPAEREQFEKATAASKIPNFPAIATREKLAEGLKQAEVKLPELSKCAEDLKGFAERNKSKEQGDALKRVLECHTIAAEVSGLYKEPMKRLLRWENLFTQAPQMKAKAHQLFGAAQAAMNRLAPTGKLIAKARKQQEVHAHKREDIDKRIAAIGTAFGTLKEHLQDVDVQATAAASGSKGFDVGAFEDAVDGVEEYSDVVTETVEDLDERLDQLDETYMLVLSSVQKIPTCKWQEVCETWGSQRNPAQGWQEVSCQRWSGIALDSRTRSDGSDFSDNGYECWVEDKDITYAYFSTTHEVTNGKSAQATRAGVDENTWYDQYGAILKLDEMFPKYGLITKKELGGLVDEGEPTAIFIATKGVVLEEKAVGMYEGEATDMPSLPGMHLNLMGNEAYGTWVGEGDSKRWQWDERHAQRWSEHEKRHGSSSGLNNFWTGYLVARMLEPRGYYGYYGYGYYGRYHDWRIRDGYDSHRYGSDGRRVSRPASYTVGGGSHARGAGPRSRSRGMGGGGK